MNIIKGLLFLFIIQCVKCDDNSNAELLIGQACKSGGVEGRCVPWRQCLTLALDRGRGLQPGVCSYNGTEPIICCTSCSLVEDVSKAVIGRSGNIYFKNSQKSWNKCLSYMSELPYACANGAISVEKDWHDEKKCHCAVNRHWSFVLSGKPAERAQFPHLALLGFGVDAEHVSEWVCTGSVISERYILTAGHCMSTKTRLPLVTAALGILKRSDPEELWQKYSIARRLPHPQYRPPTKYHDIALLRTDRIIVFSENVLPACLPSRPEPNPNEQQSRVFEAACYGGWWSVTSGFEGTIQHAEVAGWGATGHREGHADVLQYAELENYNLTACSKYYGVHRHMSRGLDEDTQLCYGDSKVMRDTCEGDSGGPLHVSSGIMYCQHTVIGVTSFGLQCGLQRQPGVYTRVQHYVPWIESVVWPED